jgi:hypothetical protein
LPWLAIPKDGVEHGEKLSSEGDELWFSGAEKTPIEGFEDGIEATGDHGGHEESGTDGFSTTADHAPAAPLAGLSCEGRKTGQAGDLFGVEGAKLGQFGDEGPRGLRPYAGDIRSRRFRGSATGLD